MNSTAPAPSARQAPATQAGSPSTSGSQGSGGAEFADLLDRAGATASPKQAAPAPAEHGDTAPARPSPPPGPADGTAPADAARSGDATKVSPKDRRALSKAASAATPKHDVSDDSPAPVATGAGVSDPALQPAPAPVWNAVQTATAVAKEPATFPGSGGAGVDLQPAAMTPAGAQATGVPNPLTSALPGGPAAAPGQPVVAHGPAAPVAMAGRPKAVAGARQGGATGTAKAAAAMTGTLPGGAQSNDTDASATSTGMDSAGQPISALGGAGRRQAARDASDLTVPAAVLGAAPPAALPDAPLLSQIAQSAVSAPQVTAAAPPQLAPGAPIATAAGATGGADPAAAALPSAPAGTQPATDPSPATPADAASPARQLAPALVQIAHAASGSSITLRLDPGELGQVHVRIERDTDGTASVHVAADRPETLRLLVADQQALHRALDSAGVSPDGRSLTLSLSTPDGRGNATADGGGSTFMGSGSFAGNGGGGGQQGGAWRQDRTPYSDAVSPPPTAAAWLRAGVDITA